MAELTAKQESYKQFRIAGNGQLASYRLAYDADGMSDNAASVEASKLEKNPMIALGIEQAREKVAAMVLVTTEDIVKGLLREAKGEEVENKSSDRIAALKALSDYTGGFDANKKQLDITTGGEPIRNEWHIHPTSSKD